jgi:hypothetical protein
LTLKKRSFASLSKAEAGRVAEFMEQKVVDAVEKFNLIGGSSVDSFHLYHAVYDAIMNEWKHSQEKKREAAKFEKLLLGQNRQRTRILTEKC